MKAKQFLMALLAWMAINGAVSKYYTLHHLRPSSGWPVLSALVSNALVFCWYYFDSKAMAYLRSKSMNIAIIAAGLLSAPFYLWQSRAQGKKVTALFKCIAFYASLLVSHSIGGALATIPSPGDMLPPNAEISELVKQAEAGNVDVQFRLVKLFGQGIGTLKAPERAKYWFNRAVESGHPEAQYWTGYKFFYGQDVKTDYVKALEWYEKSALQGYAPAQFSTAYLYEMGHSLDPKLQNNFEKANYWFEMAAQQQDTGAQFRLGCLKYFGLGTTKDHEQGAALIRMASAKGHEAASKAMQNLEKMNMEQIAAACDVHSK